MHAEKSSYQNCVIVIQTSDLSTCLNSAQAALIASGRWSIELHGRHLNWGEIFSRGYQVDYFDVNCYLNWQIEISKKQNYS